MPQCAVVGCNNTHRRTKGGSVKYHRFPGDIGTRNQWLKACGKNLNNCSTARICSRHFSQGSYERDVQHELLGLPTRCRLKRGAIPDRNLPSDFFKEDKPVDSAIAILLAVGLVPAAKQSGNSGGLPEDLNKMQIMEDVREGCDANPPSSPGHAEQAKCSSEDNKSTHSDIVTENGIVEPQEEAVQIKQEEEEEEKRSVNEAEADEKQEENSNHSSTSSEPIKRKIDEETCNPIKKLKTDIENHFLDRDKVMSEFVELADCNNLEQIQSFSEQVLGEIKTLNEMAKEKEREWNQLLHMKKFKEELLIRLQRKRQVLIINESDLNEFQPETNGQQSLLKCNQKLNMLRELRAANLEKLKQRNSLLQNSPFKQKPMLDVQSIIADYRQRHPETVPRRGRRIRHSQIEKSSILGVSGGSIVAGLENNDCGYTVNGSSSNNRQEDVKSYKDILVQFAKLSQAERSELQAQLQNSGKPPPPPYPEVTVHPVTSTSSVAPTNSLLHGILTKGPVRHSSNTTNGNNAPPNGSKSSFSPTLARLLTAPEKSGGNPLTSTPTMLGASLLSAGNMSLSEIFSGAKVRNEITITPVGSHYEISTKTDPMEDESEDQPDRLIIDETSDNSSNMKSKEDNRSEDGEEVPQCQGCNRKFAQFVCAGCGNQWYCSRECQAGRVGVFGGSIEFTGAPYFSSIAALRVGADLSYVFTIKDAAFVIKSYSPELMVLPFLDDPDVINKISPWVDRLHVALLGPGMGRLDSTKAVFEKIVQLCRTKQIPLLIDADGLFFIAQNPDIIKDYPKPVILTPNKMEFKKIVGENQPDIPKVELAKQFLQRVGPNITIFCKDAVDEIITLGKSIQLSGGGSGRRCGGQGDMLGGAMSTFLIWALKKEWEPAVACYAASKLTRDCNAKGFSKYGRSMVVTDMLYELPQIFKENFELQE
ncbi:uncharacterized protein [Euwallacea fornicatus]|uniref:uncharacterized protein isoform X5 n=1 Tax=Euwallacea fornicatus TaxID=995702 RepID=UPI00338FFAD6